jgi:hypothetical protein
MTGTSIYEADAAVASRRVVLLLLSLASLIPCAISVQNSISLTQTNEVRDGSLAYHTGARRLRLRTRCRHPRPRDDDPGSRSVVPADRLHSELRCKWLSYFGWPQCRFLQVSALTARQIACLISAGSRAGCHNPLDLPCQCKVADSISSYASPCVMSECGTAVGSSLQSVAAAICTECSVA